MTNGVKIDELGRRYIEVELKWEGDEEIENTRAYEGKCLTCGRLDFLVPQIELCGPCTFGEASTAGGNW